jgi:3-deoxy-manno-octulosonate cytidylyltransferase (CMP-KDO synthetase)
MSALAAIPARLKSTRFPRKVLADIHGRPMLWHVYNSVSKSKLITDVWVLTDDEEVFEAAISWGAKALMTRDDCPSGTARIASVIDKLNADFIINVQGDEPLITSELVDLVVETMGASDSDVVTPVYRITTVDELLNPNVTKAVLAPDGQALYFSRSPIPYVRDVDTMNWLSAAEFWGHVGVYGYRRNVLQQYFELPGGRLESAEKLEQLRLLEAGKRILTVEIDNRPQGVDVPADLETVKRAIDPDSIPR